VKNDSHRIVVQTTRIGI